MINRIIYALLKSWQYRKALHQVRRDVSQHVPNILSLSSQVLYDQGIRALVLDFDGVLASHGSLEPFSEVKSWLQEAIKIFGVERVFILSNNPIPGRIAYFAVHYPQLKFIAGIKKKPYPDGVIAISHLSGIALDAILVVDDRLLTGVLSALIAGAKAVHIDRPYINWKKRPIREAFFLSLRVMENAVFD